MSGGMGYASQPPAFVINIILVIVLFFLLLGVFVWLRGYEIFDMTFHPNLCVNFEELDYPVQATPPEVRAHRLQFIARALKVRQHVHSSIAGRLRQLQ
eukprot:scaffold7929_cov309-Prasinococcus_capsulatus_cf.AAC.1